jgi:hypothetical protein
MNFRKATQNEVAMTGLVGYVMTDYKTLVEKLGEPHYTGEGEKVTCEWQIVIDNQVVATIYDWKEHKTPKGMYNWHIGGKSKLAEELVNRLVKG